MAWANEQGGHDNITRGARSRERLTRTTEETEHMAQFTAQVYQNEFLPDGGTDVHAIVTGDVHRRRSGRPGRRGRGGRDRHRRHVRLDGSGRDPGRPAGRARGARPGAGRHLVRRHRRQPPGLAGVPAATRARARWPGWTPRPGEAARAAITTFARRRRHRDGHLARGWPSRSSTPCRSATQRHAILLTDGKNQHETPDELTRRIAGGRRALPVRLPRGRRRLGGRRGAPDRHRADGHGRPDPDPGADGRPSSRS